jgi:type I restriction enzyme S subunit
MMARLMKDSGIEWIGDIPEDWDVCKFKQLGAFSANGVDKKIEEGELLFKSVHYMNVYNNSLSEIYNSDDYLTISANEWKSQDCNLKKGDVLFTNSSETPDDMGHSAVIGESLSQTLFGYHLMRFRPKVQIYLQYEKYLFGSHYLRKWFEFRSIGMTRYGISRKDFTDALIALPSFSKQQKIADYLDRKCSLIDSTIEKEKSVIEKLKAYKQSLITELVTGKLKVEDGKVKPREAAEMKPSGIEWIGDIPVGWEIIHLKYLVSNIESGVSVNAGQNEAEENEYGVLKTSCVSKYEFDIHENKSVNRDEEERVDCPVRANTIIVSRMNTPELVGACGYVNEGNDRIFLPDRLWQVHFKSNIEVKYIWYYLRSKNVRNYYASLSTGTSSSMQNISQGQFVNAYVPFPSNNEQRTVISLLDIKCSEIYSTIVKKQNLIDKLTTYKKSLIYECVTGKREIS